MSSATATMDRPMNYSRISQILHWLSMILILVLWAAGFIMTDILSAGETQTTMYRTHVFGGYLVLLLTLIRVGLIFFEKRPAPPEGVTGFKRVLFEGNHYALYVILLLLVFSGSGMLITSGLTPAQIPTLTPEMVQDVVARQGHDVFSKIFLLLLVAHIVGVMRYQFMDGDVMKRMGVPFPGRKSA